MNPHEIHRTLREAVDSGDLGLDETLEHAAKKLSELLGWDSLDIVELSMALDEKGIEVTTVRDLIRLFESGFDGTGL